MRPSTPSRPRPARRLSEIRGLKVSNVDFGVGVLRFEDGFTTNGGHAGNKGRRVRSVPMTANVRSALAPFCEGKTGNMLVFEHDAKPGEPICGTCLYRRFLSAAKRAGLPVLRLHDLRHTFGTQAIRAFKIHEVQRMMGHRHITTTERYLHYAPDPDAAAKLTALWGGADSEEETNVVPLRRGRLTAPRRAGERGEPHGFAPLFVRFPLRLRGAYGEPWPPRASSAQAPRTENMPIWRQFS